MRASSVRMREEITARVDEELRAQAARRAEAAQAATALAEYVFDRWPEGTDLGDPYAVARFLLDRATGGVDVGLAEAASATLEALATKQRVEAAAVVRGALGEGELSNAAVDGLAAYVLDLQGQPSYESAVLEIRKAYESTDEHRVLNAQRVRKAIAMAR